MTDCCVEHGKFIVQAQNFNVNEVFCRYYRNFKRVNATNDISRQALIMVHNWPSFDHFRLFCSYNMNMLHITMSKCVMIILVGNPKHNHTLKPLLKTDFRNQFLVCPNVIFLPVVHHIYMVREFIENWTKYCALKHQLHMLTIAGVIWKNW